MDLQRIRVLDLSRLLPAAYATQLLVDMGADVLKVEEPTSGDYLRSMEPTGPAGQNALFDSVNRGKRSLSLDLKEPAGRETFYALLDDADVVFESFRPGVAERLGVDYDTLTAKTDDLIYCSLTGYGETGPYRDRPGHDVNYLGYTGFLDMTRGDESEPPEIPGVPMADMASGVFAALTIVGGILTRELGNGGSQYYDVSMMDSVLSMSHPVSVHAARGEDPRPGETRYTGQFPSYGIYETSDGRYVSLGSVESAFWETFCRTVDRPDLIDKHHSSDPAVREQLRAELTEIFASKTRAAWDDLLSDSEHMFGVVKTPREVMDDEHVRARGILKPSEHSFERMGYPARSPGESFNDPEWEAPSLGEHTEQVLEEYGFMARDIDRLESEGAI